jgi:hypothetical protein
MHVALTRGLVRRLVAALKVTLTVPSCPASGLLALPFGLDRLVIGGPAMRGMR